MIIGEYRNNKKSGYSFAEILVVVAIIGLLATLAAPVYLQHIQRAKASEAIATMTMIRQALRDYYINNSSFFEVTSGNIDEQPTTGVGVDVGIAQYFSNGAFTVTTTLTSPRFSPPPAQDFVIVANGANSTACGTSDCALHQSDVSNFCLEMDNTGRVYISYDGGGSCDGQSAGGSWALY